MPGLDVQDLHLKINGVEERYLKPQPFRLAVPITDNMNLTVYGPSGCVAGAFVKLGNGAGRGDFTEFYVARDGGGNDIKGELPVAASDTLVDVGAAAYTTVIGWGAVAGAYGWTKRDDRVLVSIVTPAGSGLAGRNCFAEIRWLISRNEYATPDVMPDETTYYQNWLPTL